MPIMDIILNLQRYSTEVLSYKLDAEFAAAVEAAVNLLEAQGERIADLENELRDERYRHDRLQDFEVAEAEEYAEVKAERDDLLTTLKHYAPCESCEYCDYEHEICTNSLRRYLNDRHRKNRPNQQDDC